MDPIHLCHGISGSSVDRAAAVLGAGAREARIWHCSWTTGAMLHRKVGRTSLKIWLGGIFYLSRCSSEIKTEGWTFHARLESMNPSAILLVACAVAVRWAGLWD